MKSNKEKRLLKTEPRFKIQLTDEQKEVKSKFYEYDINFVNGRFASGKTLVSCNIALTAFRKKQFNKIVITRPMVRNTHGFLPGSIEDKMAPLVAPIIHNLNMLQSPNTTDKMQADGELEILPIDFAKGITFVDSVVIVDEYEDLNYEDFRLLLTRVGRDSKIIFCGDERQVDKSINKHSCIYDVKKLKESNLVGYSVLTSNHRNEAISKVLKYLEDEN